MKELYLMERTPTGWKKAEGYDLVVERPAPQVEIVVDPPPPPPPPAPPAVMGYRVGTCHTYSKTGKTVMNKQLWAAGFRWNANLRCSRPLRYRNGRVEKFEIRHYSAHDVVTRVS